jgi:hypothetical protein
MKECKSGHCDIEASSGDACSCGCGCSSGCSCGCDGKAGEFLSLAKSAHHELLKQKMKAAFEAKIGKKMDKVAEHVVNTALIYMKDNMAEKQTYEQFERKLLDIFRG